MKTESCDITDKRKIRNRTRNTGAPKKEKPQFNADTKSKSSVKFDAMNGTAKGKRKIKSPDLTIKQKKGKTKSSVKVDAIEGTAKGKKIDGPKIKEINKSIVKTSSKRKLKSPDVTVMRNKRPRKEVKVESIKSKSNFRDTEEGARAKRSRKKVKKQFTVEAKESDLDFDSDDSVNDPAWCPDDSSDVSEIDETENLDEILEGLISLEEQEDQILNAANLEEESDGWSEFKGRQKAFMFNGRQGLQKTISPNSTPLEILGLFLDDEVINYIVLETNRYAAQTIASKNLKTFARLKKWRPTTAEELNKFFGLLIWMGLVRLGTIAAYWEVKGIYRQTVPRSVMSRNRFQVLLSMLHFSDNTTNAKDDRLAKIQPLLDILEKKFKEIFHPGVDIVIDETLVPWRGRLVFRQFLPLKAHKYGVKLFKLCSTDGYTWAIIIYSGKSTSGSEVGLALRICQELTKEIINEGRTLYIDNFYTSYPLAKYFITNNTHVVGTFRANMKGIPKEVLLAKLKKGEVISREDENGIVVLKWKDARDVRLLSTKHAPTLQLVEVNECGTQPSTDLNPTITDLTGPTIDSPQPTTSATVTQSQPTTAVPQSQPTTTVTQSQPITTVTQSKPSTTNKQKPSRKKVKSKPLAVLAYNKGKVGIDLSDQMASYATTLRKGVKWYRKLGIELLLGTAVVNAWVVYNRATNQKVHIRTFRERIASGLLRLKDDNQNSRLKGNEKSHHLAPRINSKGQKVRRKCNGCYAKLRKEQGRSTARNRAKMVNTFCEKCVGSPQYCLSCFNSAHK